MRRVVFAYPVAAAAMSFPGIASLDKVPHILICVVWAVLVCVFAALVVALMWSDNRQAAANCALISWCLLFPLTLGEAAYWAFYLLPAQALLGWIVTREHKRDRGQAEHGDQDQDQGPDHSEHSTDEGTGDDAGHLED